MTYDYMAPNDALETETTAREIDKLRVEQPDLKGDDLLNLASKRAGYDPGYSGVEICDGCGMIYHRDYGGEYIDPHDCDDLCEELGVTTEQLLTLSYKHFHDFSCLRSNTYF